MDQQQRHGACYYYLLFQKPYGLLHFFKNTAAPAAFVVNHHAAAALGGGNQKVSTVARPAAAVIIRRRRRTALCSTVERPEDNGGRQRVAVYDDQDARTSNTSRNGAAISPFAPGAHGRQRAWPPPPPSAIRQWAHMELGRRKRRSFSLHGNARKTFRPTNAEFIRLAKTPFADTPTLSIISARRLRQGIQGRRRGRAGMGTHASEQLLWSETCQHIRPPTAKVPSILWSGSFIGRDNDGRLQAN
jgi:hypothetical protein